MPYNKTTLFAKNNLIPALTAQHNDVKISVGQLLIPIANDSAQARGLREERSDGDTRVDAIVAEVNGMLQLLDGNAVQVVDGHLVALQRKKQE